jgi:hypothetical protein
MAIVEAYAAQVEAESIGNAPVNPSEVGSRVKLFAWGREMQAPHSKTAKLNDFLPRCNKSGTNGIITVKWDGLKQPVLMHVNQLEVLK